ncbi:MAG: 30S ribosomal protein S5 [Candidatus Caldatribacteriota bacterium]|jgi:small subunit ribosomal protein S5|nr:30S ribosomal protein S5 [Atribacterota bacterium]MDD3030914.1 30S ribosomal protein S5 [Atribacterota bacterium]MDD3641338.1 30S ribosomal protein S5 [Atribacterota bacterium]MDD4288486.1 30S ribosomal protein S5 [Atribacterota bacterium]MDD4764319.1 30S ribosomal protein S5 [Atribacterota bacterium]
MQRVTNEEQEFKESVVFVNRVSKVVKGGRRFGFSAMVVVGNGNGSVGIGYGKAKDVSDAIKKGVTKAKKEMYKIKTRKNTIPHTVTGVHSGAKVFLRPASPGTGVIAGGAVRAIIEAAGIQDILTKSLGSDNNLNIVRATMKALLSLKNAREVAKLRGIPVEKIYS